MGAASREGEKVLQECATAKNQPAPISPKKVVFTRIIGGSTRELMSSFVTDRAIISRNAQPDTRHHTKTATVARTMPAGRFARSCAAVQAYQEVYAVSIFFALMASSFLTAFAFSSSVTSPFAFPSRSYLAPPAINAAW